MNTYFLYGIIIFACILGLFIGALCFLLVKEFIIYLTKKREMVDGIEALGTSIGFYFNAKTERNRNNAQESIDNLKATNDLLNLIDDLIATEISGRLQKLLVLRKQYEFLNVDQDIVEITTLVKDSLNLNKISRNETFVTIDYLFHYIVIQTRDQLLTKGKEYNLALTTYTSGRDET